MLIGVWGHSATGKTTWLRSIMDELADANPNLVIVLGDNAEEYYLKDDVWHKVENHDRWQGKKEQKLQWSPDLMIATDTVWVVESMRWYNGLQQCLVDAFNRNQQQGLHMIIPHAQGAVHQEFIRQRCIKSGKKMSDWWTIENCDREANYRLGSIEKWWKPNRVPATSFEIDADRRNWLFVTQYVKELLCQAK